LEKSINSTAGTINSTVGAIDGTAKTINITAKAIDTRSRERGVAQLVSIRRCAIVACMSQVVSRLGASGL
jgi:hypothetical protein